MQCAEYCARLTSAARRFPKGHAPVRAGSYVPRTRGASRGAKCEDKDPETPDGRDFVPRVSATAHLGGVKVEHLQSQHGGAPVRNEHAELVVPDGLQRLMTHGRLGTLICSTSAPGMMSERVGFIAARHAVDLAPVCSLDTPSALRQKE
eukprot:scaffold82785_cov30-Tisochrysis_lutea.AAC.7